MVGEIMANKDNHSYWGMNLPPQGDYKGTEGLAGLVRQDYDDLKEVLNEPGVRLSDMTSEIDARVEAGDYGEMDGQSILEALIDAKNPVPASGLLGMTKGMKKSRYYDVYHAARDVETVKKIEKEGFTYGSSAELNVPGTSVSRDPLMSLLIFGDNELDSLLKVIPKKGSHKEAYNLTPSEYLSGQTPDLKKGAVYGKIAAPHYESENYFVRAKEIKDFSPEQLALKKATAADMEVKYGELHKMKRILMEEHSDLLKSTSSKYNKLYAKTDDGGLGDLLAPPGSPNRIAHDMLMAVRKARSTGYVSPSLIIEAPQLNSLQAAWKAENKMQKDWHEIHSQVEEGGIVRTHLPEVDVRQLTTSEKKRLLRQRSSYLSAASTMRYINENEMQIDGLYNLMKMLSIRFSDLSTNKAMKERLFIGDKPIHGGEEGNIQGLMKLVTDDQTLMEQLAAHPKMDTKKVEAFTRRALTVRELRSELGSMQYDITKADTPLSKKYNKMYSDYRRWYNELLDDFSDMMSTDTRASRRKSHKRGRIPEMNIPFFDSASYAKQYDAEKASMIKAKTTLRGGLMHLPNE